MIGVDAENPAVRVPGPEACHGGRAQQWAAGDEGDVGSEVRCDAPQAPLGEREGLAGEEASQERHTALEPCRQRLTEYPARRTQHVEGVGDANLVVIGEGSSKRVDRGVEAFVSNQKYAAGVPVGG